MVKKTKTALLILAAGNSSRMGQPKQLLPWKKTTLLGNVINEGKACDIHEIYVVLGAFYEKIKEVLLDEKVKIVHNTNWENGMATSVAMGIKEIQLSKTAYDHVLIALCDQPLIEAGFFNKLIDTLVNNDKKAVATCYENSPGVPAVFKASTFEALKKLDGKKGAKALLRSLGENVICLKSDVNTVDVDTPEVYLKLYKTSSK